MGAAAASQGRLPRALLVLGIVLAGLVLVCFFVYRGFPYDQLRVYLTAQLERSSGADVVIQSLGPRLGLAGPGVEAGGVSVALAGGERIRFERVLLRPAWSFSWLRGQPAVWTEFEGPPAAGQGTLVLNGGGAFAGDVLGLDLERLPVASLAPGSTLTGRADAAIDLVLEPEGPVGSVVFEAREGSLVFPNLPMPIVYDRITGELLFGGEGGYLEIRALDVVSELGTAAASGSVGRAQRLEQAPLDLEIRVQAASALAGGLRSLGVRVRPDGSTLLRVAGTPARPVVQ